MNVIQQPAGGAVGQLNATDVLAASSLIKQGRVYSLAVKAGSEAPCQPGRKSFRAHIGRIQLEGVWSDGQDGSQAVNDVGYGSNRLFGYDDWVEMGCGIGTHIDGLGHISTDGLIYGDLPVDEVITEHGALQHGIETIPPIVCRGVLLDIPRVLGLSRLEPGYEITVDDIQRAAAAQDLVIRPKDALFFHTGTITNVAYTAEFGGLETEAGPGLDAAKYLVDELGVAVVGADNWALEVVSQPLWKDASPSHRGDHMPVHGFLLRERGVHILEYVYTREIADAGISEFMCVLAPPRLVGAVQAPLQPIAIV